MLIVAIIFAKKRPHCNELHTRFCKREKLENWFNICYCIKYVGGFIVIKETVIFLYCLLAITDFLIFLLQNKFLIQRVSLRKGHTLTVYECQRGASK